MNRFGNAAPQQIATSWSADSHFLPIPGSEALKSPPAGFVDPNLLIIGTSDHVLRYWPLDGGDVLGPTLTQ
jgi:hypothetical protein